MKVLLIVALAGGLIAAMKNLDFKGA